jgi:Cell Wall Hydrolase
MGSDTDALSDTEILAATAIGEAESLGHDEMARTINSIMNRAKANIKWMGGGNPRNVCLQRRQYDCWNPGDDRDRIMHIATQNPLYDAYVDALGLASDALAGDLPDGTNGAVSYFDSDACKTPFWAVGKEPCFSAGFRRYFNLAAVV